MIENKLNLMKIFLLISHNVNGGGEKVFSDLLKNLSNKYETIGIQTYNTNTTFSNQKNIVLYKQTSSLIKKIFHALLLPLHYIHLFKLYQPSVSISLTPIENIINIFSCKLMGVKPIVSYHADPFSEYQNTLERIQSKLLVLLIILFNVDVIAVSKNIKEMLHNKYHISDEKITVIYNPIDIESIQEKSREHTGINQKNTTFISVGRLSHEKAIQHIIRAFAKYLEYNKGTLYICGEGPEEPYLKQLTINYNIQDSVIFLGWQKNPYKYMAQAYVLIQSSITEALPLVLAEAMACGCPIIATKCSPGISEIIGTDSKCGILTSKVSGNRHSSNIPLEKGEEDILNSMITLHTNKILRNKMSDECLNRVLLFDKEIGIEQYIRLIERIEKS